MKSIVVRGVSLVPDNFRGWKKSEFKKWGKGKLDVELAWTKIQEAWKSK